MNEFRASSFPIGCTAYNKQNFVDSNMHTFSSQVVTEIGL